MNDITNSEVYKIAATVQSSVTSSPAVNKPNIDFVLQSLQHFCMYENCSNMHSLGKLYGKNGNVGALFNAIFEGIKSKEPDPVVKEKITHLHKCFEHLLSYFATNFGKQLTETEFSAILAGFFTTLYEKQSN